MVYYLCNHEKCQKQTNKHYKTVEALNQHLTKDHLLAKCNQCNKFYTRKHLKKHTKEFHGGSISCPFCKKPFGSQRRLLRRHYKYCSKAKVEDLSNAMKSRHDIDACFTDFYKQKSEQHFSKPNINKKIKSGSIPKHKIPIPTPIKFRNRSINKRSPLIKFFE